MNHRLAGIQRLSWRAGLAYGLPGLPLAFVALPLYVVLPHYYATDLGLPLATIGGLLMAVRLADAVVEPWVGRCSDWLLRRDLRQLLGVAGLAALLLLTGMTALFFPLVQSPPALAVWLVGGLLLTCVMHSLLLICHQSWGVRLGGDDAMRGRIVAWREGPALVGVVLASGVAVVWGPGAMLLALGMTLAGAALAWSLAPRPQAVPATERVESCRQRHPLAHQGFRRLLLVFLCNGIASAIPASLMLFFVQDRLQLAEQATSLFLIIYFVCGAASMPLWLRLVPRLGLAGAWLSGVLLAIAGFVGAAGLAAGEGLAFALICAVTGLALGADLVLPGALLARLLGLNGAQGSSDGVYLGWWNMATKLNLALAAGTVLPILQWMGYTPGATDEGALQRLSWAYAWAPCGLKLMAAVLLYVLLVRSPSRPASFGV